MDALTTEQFQEKRVKKKRDTLLWNWFVKVLYLLIFVDAICAGFITYIMGVRNEHVAPLLPWITDMAAVEPETSNFSFWANVAIVKYMIITIAYYNIIKTLMIVEDHRESGMTLNAKKIIKITKINQYSLVFGTIGVIGALTVANINTQTLYWFHVFGAVLVFVGFASALMLSMMITVFLSPKFVSRRIKTFRITLVTFMLINIIIFLITGAMAVLQFKHPIASEKRLHWGPDDGGYHMHAVSAGTQWLAGYSILLFYMSYFYEFNKFY